MSARRRVAGPLRPTKKRACRRSVYRGIHYDRATRAWVVRRTVAGVDIKGRFSSEWMAVMYLNACSDAARRAAAREAEGK